jgi:signal transduction histidine kinase
MVYFRNSDAGAHSPSLDIGLIALATAVTALLAVRLELSEWFFSWTRHWEHLELDELAATLLVLCAGLVWFAVRRYREARSEIARRRTAEARLENLLLDNRRLAQRCGEVQEAERKVLARELHDEFGQYLNAIKIDAVAIQESRPQSATLVEAASSIVRHTDHLYTVVRDRIRNLRPIGLDELGLEAAIEQYVSDWQPRLPGVQLSVSFNGDLDSIAEPMSLVLYRILQEGITNVSRHARAKRVSISVCRTGADSAMAGDEVALTLIDDGCGSDLCDKCPGVGLIGMRERVEMLGGRLQVTSAPGAGFGILARIPAGDIA